jgi:uncharacterized protein
VGIQRIDTVLLKVASRCNIACDYCYVYNMGDAGWSRVPKGMCEATIDAVVGALSGLYADQRHPFAVVLHGGEPFLLGEPRLSRLLRGLRRVLDAKFPLSIQTNGTLLTEQLLDLCFETNTTISVSLDGPAEVNDLHRVGFARESTYEKTIAGIRLLRGHPQSASLFTGVLCVVDPFSDPEAIYSFFKTIGVPSLNFLFRDGNHSRLPYGKQSFDSHEYGSWLARLWEAYYRDPAPIPIRTLDDIGRLILGGRATKEGMGTTDYAVVVIDTDGTISKNDTLKSSFDGADKFTSQWSVFRDRIFTIAQTEEFRSYVRLQQPTSEACRRCPYLRQCGGGMPLSRWSDEREFDNPSIYCNDQKLVIDYIRGSLAADLQCTSR